MTTWTFLPKMNAGQMSHAPGRSVNAPPLQASSGLNQQKLSLEGLPPGKMKERLSGLRPPSTPPLCVGASECVGTRRSPSLSNTTYFA